MFILFVIFFFRKIIFTFVFFKYYARALQASNGLHNSTLNTTPTNFHPNRRGGRLQSTFLFDMESLTMIFSNEKLEQKPQLTRGVTWRHRALARMERTSRHRHRRFPPPGSHVYRALLAAAAAAVGMVGVVEAPRWRSSKRPRRGFAGR